MKHSILRFQPLPEFHRVDDLQLDGESFAHALMTIEFINNFSDALRIGEIKKNSLECFSRRFPPNFEMWKNLRYHLVSFDFPWKGHEIRVLNISRIGDICRKKEERYSAAKSSVPPLASLCSGLSGDSLHCSSVQFCLSTLLSHALRLPQSSKTIPSLGRPLSSFKLDENNQDELLRLFLSTADAPGKEVRALSWFLKWMMVSLDGFSDICKEHHGYYVELFNKLQ